MNSSRTWIYLSITLIIVLGLVTIWSTTPDLFFYQLSFVLAGLLIAILITKSNLVTIFAFSWAYYFLTILLLVITLIIGQATRGSVRWIDLGFFRLQTSEIAKPLLAVFYSFYLSQYQPKDLVPLIKYVFVFLTPVILVAIQPDLGSAIVLFSLPVALLVASGIKRKYYLLSAVLAVLLLPLGTNLIKPYQMERLYSFVDPYHDPQGAGYNIIQSIIAVGSGGIFGRGVGLGTQSHLNYLPERHTDFAFASFTEEFGLFGALVLLGAYFLLFLRILNSADITRDRSYVLLHQAIFVIIFVQVVVNIGMNLGLLPVTGITLPMFSYGGSSLISFLILIGLELKLLDLTPMHRI